MYGILADPDCEPDAALYKAAAHSKDVCNLGVITVSIPAARKSGAISAVDSGDYVTDKDVDDYFWTMRHTPLCKKAMEASASYDEFCRLGYFDDPADMFARVVASLPNANSKNDAFVFVHGFNVEFRSAVFRAAQLKYDMKFNGPVFLYSWPSNGTTTDYFSDQVDGDLSVDGLVRFLNLVNETITCPDAFDGEPCNKTDAKVHIIAHSMGARVTSQALARVGSENPQVQFGQLIFAAGDVDHALFQEWIGASMDNVDGVTIYTSRYDGAVGLASFFRNFRLPWDKEGDDNRPRLGFVEENGYPFVFQASQPDGEAALKKIHTIDISSLTETTYFNVFNWKSWFIKNHSRYAETYTVTDDILDVMCEGGIRDPESRGVADPKTYFRSDDTKQKYPQTYWVMRNDSRGGNKLCAKYAGHD